MTLADGPVILVLLDDDGTRRLHLVLAEGWQVHDAPGTLAVLRPAEDHGWFRTNVVISREGVPADLDLANVMAAGERHVAATYDAVEVRSECVAHCGDAVAVVRLRAFDVRNEGVRLSQLHALLDADLEHPHSSARVIYQIVASCLAEDTARFQHAFATMIGSCRVHLSPTRERPEEIE